MNRQQYDKLAKRAANYVGQQIYEKTPEGKILGTRKFLGFDAKEENGVYNPTATFQKSNGERYEIELTTAVANFTM